MALGFSQYPEIGIVDVFGEGKELITGDGEGAEVVFFDHIAEIIIFIGDLKDFRGAQAFVNLFFIRQIVSQPHFHIVLTEGQVSDLPFIDLP